MLIYQSLTYCSANGSLQIRSTEILNFDCKDFLTETLHSEVWKKLEPEVAYRRDLLTSLSVAG